MKHESEHIDKLFREKLKNYNPDVKRNKMIWYVLGVKLLFLNLSASAIIAFTSSLIIVGGGTTYVLVEKPFTSQSDSKDIPIETNTFRNIPALKFDETLFGFTGPSLDDLFGKIRLRDNYRHLYTNNFKVNTETSEQAEQAKKAEQNNPVRSANAGRTDINPMDFYGKSPDMVRSMKDRKDLDLTSTLLSLKGRDKNIPALDSLLDHYYQKRKLTVAIFINPGIDYPGKATALFEQPGQTLKIDGRNKEFSAGMGVNLRYHSGHWIFTTGFNYLGYSEKGAYEYNQVKLDPANLIETVDTVYRWIYDPPQIGVPLIFSIDTLYLPGYKTFRHVENWQLKNHLIEIPLMAGYTFQIHNIEVELSTGITMGLPIRQTGGIPTIGNSSELSIQKIDLEQPVFSYIIRAGINYPLNEHYRLMFQPNLQRNFTGFYRNSNLPVSQQHSRIGLSFGLIYDL